MTRFVIFVGAALLGAGVAAVQFIPAVSYVVEHSRRTATTTDASAEESRAYGSSFSLHPEEVVALAVPEFVGVSSANAEWARGTYWGRNGFKGNHEYVGLVVLLLAGVSFFGGAQRSLRLFLAALGGVALLFGLGSHTPVWRIFYEIVPGVDLFRSPSLAIFLFGFSVVTLMAFGVERLLDLERKGSEADWVRPGRFLWIASSMALVGFVLASSAVERLSGALPSIGICPTRQRRFSLMLSRLSYVVSCTRWYSPSRLRVLPGDSAPLDLPRWGLWWHSECSSPWI